MIFHSYVKLPEGRSPMFYASLSLFDGRIPRHGADFYQGTGRHRCARRPPTPRECRPRLKLSVVGGKSRHILFKNGKYKIRRVQNPQHHSIPCFDENWRIPTSWINIYDILIYVYIYIYPYILYHTISIYPIIIMNYNYGYIIIG